MNPYTGPATRVGHTPKNHLDGSAPNAGHVRKKIESHERGIDTSPLASPLASGWWIADEMGGSARLGPS